MLGPRPKDPKRSAEHANGPAHDPPHLLLSGAATALAAAVAPGLARSAAARCRPPGRRRQATTGLRVGGPRGHGIARRSSRDPACHVLAAGTRRRRAAAGSVPPDGPIRTPVNAFAVNTGERLYLVDLAPRAARARRGASAGGAGRGRTAVRGRGRGDSHPSHVDHAGGLVRDGKAVYLNAQIVVADAEAAFWLDEAIAAKAPDGVRRSSTSPEPRWRPTATGHADEPGSPRRRLASR